MDIKMQPVAIVRNSRTEVFDDFWGAVESEIELVDSMPDSALDGVDLFSHLEILFYFHSADPKKVMAEANHPRNNASYPKVGIFARRGKNRPNHIGLTIVRLISTAFRVIRVSGLDAVDGTPILDIKPVMSGFLPPGDIKEPSWSKEMMSDYWKK